MIPALPKSTIKPALRLAAAVLLCLFGAAAAHEGEHDEDEAPAPAGPAAPPAASPMPSLDADTPQLELVVKRQDGEVLLYIDDYATDAPLDGLQVAVRSGNRALQAAAAGQGVYRLPADLLDPAAGTALRIEVHGHGIEANVQGELPPAPAQPVKQAASSLPHPPVWAWGTAAAVALLSLLLFRLRLRRRALAA